MGALSSLQRLFGLLLLLVGYARPGWDVGTALGHHRRKVRHLRNKAAAPIFSAPVEVQARQNLFPGEFFNETTLPKWTLPPRSPGPYTLGMVTIHTGPLPSFLDYFISAAHNTAPMMQFFIFHSDALNISKASKHYAELSGNESDTHSVGNVHFRRWSINKLARKMKEVLVSNAHAFV